MAWSGGVSQATNERGENELFLVQTFLTSVVIIQMLSAEITSAIFISFIL